MGHGNGKVPPLGPDDVTPVEWPHGPGTFQRDHVLRLPPLPAPRIELPPPVQTDPPTKRHIANVWKTTIVSCWAMTVIGVLAAMQSWPYEVTLGAIGLITGAWTIGSIFGKRP